MKEEKQEGKLNVEAVTNQDKTIMKLAQTEPWTKNNNNKKLHQNYNNEILSWLIFNSSNIKKWHPEAQYFIFYEIVPIKMDKSTKSKHNIKS